MTLMGCLPSSIIRRMIATVNSMIKRLKKLAPKHNESTVSSVRYIVKHNSLWTEVRTETSMFLLDTDITTPKAESGRRILR